jgi:hypothetical protein
MTRRNGDRATRRKIDKETDAEIRRKSSNPATQLKKR